MERCLACEADSVGTVDYDGRIWSNERIRLRGPMRLILQVPINRMCPLGHIRSSRPRPPRTRPSCAQALLRAQFQFFLSNLRSGRDSRQAPKTFEHDFHRKRSHAPWLAANAKKTMFDGEAVN